MNTHSLIAIKNEDGSIESTYCHFDGYPEHNGAVLLKHYNSEEKARGLISKGYLHSLEGTTVTPLNDQSSDQFPDESAYGAFDLCESYRYLWKKGKWYINDSILTHDIIRNGTKSSLVTNRIEKLILAYKLGIKEY